LSVRQEESGKLGGRTKGGTAFEVKLPIHDIEETLPELEKPPGREQEAFPDLCIITKAFDYNFGRRHFV
jgi:hypothetical protein